MRRIAAVLAALALIVLTASPAAAAKPEKIPDLIGDPVVYLAGEICGFDLEYRIDIDTGKSIVFPATPDRHQRVIVSGHIVATITNLENHRSGTWNISGPGTFHYGDTLTIDAHGTWLFYNFDGDAGGPGMWVVTGHSRVEVDLDTGQWLAFAPARNQLNVCAFLGG